MRKRRARRTERQRDRERDGQGRIELKGLFYLQLYFYSPTFTLRSGGRGPFQQLLLAFLEEVQGGSEVRFGSFSSCRTHPLFSFRFLIEFHICFQKLLIFPATCIISCATGFHTSPKHKSSTRVTADEVFSSSTTPRAFSLSSKVTGIKSVQPGQKALVSETPLARLRVTGSLTFVMRSQLLTFETR